MITLSQIKSIDINSNMCQVEIPIFGKTAGKNVTLNATMMLPPGIHSGYKAGDIVFVSFTDNTLGRPVVLGHLYMPTKDKVDDMTDNYGVTRATRFDTSELNVSASASLPSSTSFSYGGDQHTLKSLVDRIASLEAALAAAAAALAVTNPAVATAITAALAIT